MFLDEVVQTNPFVALANLQDTPPHSSMDAEFQDSSNREILVCTATFRSIVVVNELSSGVRHEGPLQSAEHSQLCGRVVCRQRKGQSGNTSKSNAFHGFCAVHRNRQCWLTWFIVR